jgi:lipopolysaccharide/colanic/teichoic acid biosynthesis glycosyltransferase
MNWQRIQVRLKYALDRLAAGGLLLLLAPLLTSIFLAVKLADGSPVFFRQWRAGERRRKFRCWKFRSMAVNADQWLDQQGSVVQDRITRVGRVLRKLSLDELPQLFNVLKGDMSFVGPRPILPEQAERLDADQQRRFWMRPGITGLAQVNGRNTLPWSKRIECDLQYVDQYSLWLDFSILLRTVRVVLLQEGMVLDRNPQQVDDLGLSRPCRKAA